MYCAVQNTNRGGEGHAAGRQAGTHSSTAAAKHMVHPRSDARCANWRDIIDDDLHIKPRPGVVVVCVVTAIDNQFTPSFQSSQ
jgi:hypothetical protein